MAHIAKIPDLNRGNPLHKKAEHAPAPEAPVTAAAKEAARSSDPRIDIRIYRRKLDGHYYAAVMHFSRVQPTHAVEAPLEMHGKSERDIDFELGVLCGAMAERLDELYGDNFSPDESARAGARIFADVMHKWELESKRRG